MRKIWLPTAFTAIERVEAYLHDLKAQDPSVADIQLDYPKSGVRKLEEFLAVKEDYHGMVSLLAYDMNSAVIEEVKHLKAVSNYAVGLNNVDIKCAQKHALPYGFTPDVLNEATADTAMALTLMCARKIKFAMNDIIRGGWQSFQLTRYNGVDPRNLRIGIIGLGRIGTVFAEKAHRMWGCPIYAIKRKSLEEKEFSFPLRLVSEEEFYKEVNLLSVHCPLNESTKGMINSEYLNRFKAPLIFINTARGAIHIEEDLLANLESGRLLAVGLDVTHPEPMNKDHPLLKDDRAIVLPHIGSATDRTRTEMTWLALNNVIEVMRGRPMPHCAWN